MLYLFLILLVALTAAQVCLGIVPYTGSYLRARWLAASFPPAWEQDPRTALTAAARVLLLTGRDWKSVVFYLLMGVMASAAVCSEKSCCESTAPSSWDPCLSFLPG